MNGKQMGVLCAGVAIIGALLLFPPFEMTPNLADLLKSQFAGFIGASAPPPPPLVKYGFLFAPPSGSAGIDWGRAWPPMAFVAAATGLLTAALGRRAEISSSRS